MTDSGDSAHAPGTPPAEVRIDHALVGALLATQHADLAHLPLEAVATGWDNAMFRLGAQLAVRLPRRAVAAPLLVAEQTWLPRLAGQVTLPIPAPLRQGAPGCGYPWRWSIVPWLGGAAADQQAPDPAQAPVLAAFLRSLHTPAPADAPANPYRGVPLAQRAPFVEERLARLARQTSLVTPRLRQLWQAALAAPIDVAPTWIHGDLHPQNILVAQGALAAIIDWGDLTSGDCATDLAALWMLFELPQARHAALAAYGRPSPATVRRAQGWALFFGSVLLDTGLQDNPRHAAASARTLRRLDAAHDSGA